MVVRVIVGSTYGAAGEIAEALSHKLHAAPDLTEAFTET